jgi:nitroreductase
MQEGRDMMLRELVLKNRSCRRFYEDHAVERGTLEELVDLARYTASAGNLQPLKYLLSSDRRKNELIFPNLAWAGYLTDWPGPPPGERPSAYIIILGDTDIARSFGCDHGITAQTIVLGAREKELAGCIIASIKRDELRGVLRIPGRYEILLAVALGKPKEEVVIETVGADGDIKYWRDTGAVHYVPKRPLEELIVEPL